MKNVTSAIVLSLLSVTADANLLVCKDVCHSTPACSSDGQALAIPQCKCSASSPAIDCGWERVDCSTNSNVTFYDPC